MNKRSAFRTRQTLAAALLGLSLVATAQAQLRPSRGLPTAATQRAVQEQADYIVAVVNSEPVTHREVLLQTLRAEQRLSAQNAPVPSRQELYREALERSISDRIQIQQARESGIKIDDPTLDEAIQSIAAQNKLSVAQLQERLRADGLDWAKFRSDIRDDMMSTRFRERDFESRLRVSDAEIEAYIREQTAGQNAVSMDINLSQILVPLPDAPSAAVKAERMQLAEQIRARLARGEDMLKVAKSLEGKVDASSGELMGLKSANRYPEVFVQAVKSLPLGGISSIITTGAGHHILKLVDKKQSGLPAMSVTQTKARHILLRPSAELTETAAVSQLEGIREKISSRAATFEAMAREFSQDGSAAQGGDLGWVGPGQFVPEFEAVMNQLAPGVVSQPITSRFGVHLIEVLDRKSVQLAPDEQREMVRNLLREQKADEQFAAWQRELRSSAYVEYRPAPGQ